MWAVGGKGQAGARQKERPDCLALGPGKGPWLWGYSADGLVESCGCQRVGLKQIWDVGLQSLVSTPGPCVLSLAMAERFHLENLLGGSRSVREFLTDIFPTLHIVF